MNADSSSGNTSEKRARLPGCVTLIYHLVRLYWLTEITLLAVVVYGLIAGWSTTRQWSDVFFFAGFGQIMVAFIASQGLSRETTDSAYVRYVPGGNINEIRQQLVLDSLRQQSLGLRAFIGGLLTLVIAFVVTRF